LLYFFLKQISETKPNGTEDKSGSVNPDLLFPFNRLFFVLVLFLPFQAPGSNHEFEGIREKKLRRKRKRRNILRGLKGIMRTKEKSVAEMC